MAIDGVGHEDEQTGSHQMPNLGPLTEAGLGEGTPSPLVEEWNDALSDKQGYVLLWAGAYKGPDGENSAFDWSWMQTAVSEATSEAHTDEFTELLSSEAALWTERLLTPLAHAARIRIMQALWPGKLGSGELSDATDMSGGNLYYHLKELIHAQCVANADNGYELTELGRQLLLTLVLVAAHVMRDHGSQGKVVRSVRAYGSSQEDI